MLYGPTRTVDIQGNHVYSETNWADWSCDRQDGLFHGGILVPLICGSHTMHLMDFSRRNQVLLIQGTIGSIHSTVQNKFSYVGHMVLGCLPVPPQFQRTSSSDNRAQRNIYHQVLCGIPKMVWEPVTQCPNGRETNYRGLWPCSNGKMRRCWPISWCWSADPMEHADLMGVQYSSFPKCQTPKDELG
jgi:hypothetical protein